MRFELQHEKNLLSINHFVHSDADARIGNPYNTTFNLKVVSGSFSGVGCCEYDIKEFVEFARQINEMYHFKRDKVELHDICYGSVVMFSMDFTGHIKIKGKIYGKACLHILEFEFMADQTSLKPFADRLKQVFQIENSC